MSFSSRSHSCTSPLSIPLWKVASSRFLPLECHHNQVPFRDPLSKLHSTMFWLLASLIVQTPCSWPSRKVDSELNGPVNSLSPSGEKRCPSSLVNLWVHLPFCLP